MVSLSNHNGRSPFDTLRANGVDAHTALDRLAALAGILPEYFDVTGVRHVTSAAT